MQIGFRIVAVVVLAISLVARAVSADSDAADQSSFELRVIGSDGNPVPQASVEFRCTPSLKAEQISVGTLAKKRSYGVEIKADDKGLIGLKLPQTPNRFELYITIPGYGPYCARWTPQDTGQKLPSQLTAELETAWSMGGVVGDADGNPIKGAKISPFIEFKKPPDDHSQLGSGAEIKTDANGRWHFDSVPSSMSEVSATIIHPDFKPDHRALTRADFAIQPGAEPTAKIVLDRGVTVTGKVTDDAGNPIADALVSIGRYNERRKARTGDDGVYHLSGCQPGTTRVLVSAKNLATDAKDIQLAENMEPVDFQMKPGGHVRIRVLDTNGKPVPKAQVFFQRWRGQNAYGAFEEISKQRSDDNGVWEWNEAPLDEFEADICPPDGMQLPFQQIIARDEEYVFHTHPQLLIKGSVVDTETKEPIQKFQVLPGMRSGSAQIFWDQGSQFSGANGKFQLRESREQPAFAVKIEADGYLPAVSREIKSDEGTVDISLELKKGQGVESTVLAPDGKPAAKAKIVAAIAGDHIGLSNGDIDDRQTRAQTTTADGAGHFWLKPQTGGFQLIISHPDGFIQAASSDGSLPKTIQLAEWAKLEGIYRIGDKPAAGAPIELMINEDDPSRPFGSGGASIYKSYETTCDKDGHFIFERVVPGKGRVGRRIILMADEGAREVTSSCRLPVNFDAGKTTHIDIGGTGRPVVGQLLPPKGFEGQFKWQFMEILVQPYAPNLPPPQVPPIPADVARDPVKRTAWFLQWQQTDAGKVYTAWAQMMKAAQDARDSGPLFTATVNRDGSFQIDDVPAGNYMLSVQSFDPKNRAGRVLEYHIAIPSMDGGQSEEKLNLGEITLER